MSVADVAKLVSGGLFAVAAIAGVWAFVSRDGASTRTRAAVLGGIGLVILALGLAVWPRSEAKPTGQIVAPASGEEVSRLIAARGILAHIPEDQHVWLAVRDGNQLYPQDSEITPPDGRWSLTFEHGGKAASISLELYRMGRAGHRFIVNRFNARDFSGIARIPGAERLDAVENLRIRDQ